MYWVEPISDCDGRKRRCRPDDEDARMGDKGGGGGGVLLGDIFVSSAEGLGF